MQGIGLVIRGPSGAGKSLLALSLIEWDAALLVADDRVDITEAAGRLVMRAPPRLAGLIELRGRGIVSRLHLPEAELRLVVDLVDGLERMPEEAKFTTDLFGHALPRAPVPRAGIADLAHQRLLVLEAIRHIRATPGVARQKTT